MRTYLILKEKAERSNTDEEIQDILKETSGDSGAAVVGRFSKKGAAALLSHSFNKQALLQKRLRYERLDQLTIDLLLGVR
jgi:xylose isomerase